MKIRQAFKKNKHPRFMKQFFYHQPYGRGRLFSELVDRADLEKLAKLIKVGGLLLQTKVYLFWSTPKNQNTMGIPKDMRVDKEFRIHT